MKCLCFVRVCQFRNEEREYSQPPVFAVTRYVMLVINLLNLAVSVCTISSNIQKVFILFTQFIYTFCMYIATDSEFRPMQHPMISFYSRDRVYCAVRTEALSRTVYVQSLKG
jgi:hypothetical protein